MAEAYWILVENRRWKFLPWPRVRSSFYKECTFDEVREFVDGLRKNYSSDPHDYSLKIGVERGKHIVIIH